MLLALPCLPLQATLNYRHDAMLKHKAAVADMDAKQAAVNRHVGVAGQEAQLTAAKAKLAQVRAAIEAHNALGAWPRPPSPTLAHTMQTYTGNGCRGCRQEGVG